ncbi:MAG TPA: bifunctional phosphopantothenoylcysteine decarboxylase/phosphopantothenate--cysteine ligase CoaBC [Pyrinomonadaceae bacterium]|jgi:phosphopantothenoylcysteine decarboxylase/phosphopantothenate--cysteine ligase
MTFDDDTRETGDAATAGRRVALAVAGGIAAYKAAEVLRGLQRAGCRVRVAMTEHATKLVAPLTFRALSGEHVVVDDYAPDNPDPIAHITFAQTVDLFVVAPATADIIAKFANGVADDFVSTTYLACAAPVLVAPAMNTTMWEHPATRRNLAQLRADGVHVVEPDAGEMACGTIGPGRLSAPERIVEAALELLRARTGAAKGGGGSVAARDLAGERILITAGATREEIDPVRFISNRSSGRMGFALAEAARARGAEVTVVAGVASAPRPCGVRFVEAVSAEAMMRAAGAEFQSATVFIGAAAVADYRPASRAEQKLKKAEAALTLELVRTPDILASVAAARRAGQLVIGFAAESEDVIEHARRKLADKRLDAIVANDVTREGAGFDAETNAVTIISADRPEAVGLPLMSKLEAAHKILDEVARLRGALAGKSARAE